MRIVVVGAGKVGVTLTGILSKEGHDITIIDNSSQVLNGTQEMLDVAVVEGNGVLLEVQQAAEVGESDLLIAATPSDEINMLCCLMAKKLGCRSTVARVRNPEYDQQLDFFKEDMGLSFSINPEKTAARDIFRILQYPAFLKRDAFARGLVELVELKIKENSDFIGRRLDSLGDMWKVNALICAAERDGEVYIPSGSYVFKEGDKLTVAAETAQLELLLDTFKVPKKKIRHAMIIGGSRIAAYLASMLIDEGIKVTVFEIDRARCEELSVELPKALIINGDGADENLLYSEGLRTTDAIVTLTGIDEENIITSLLAGHRGVPKTVTKLNRLDNVGVLRTLGLDTMVSPKHLTANEIVRFVRTIATEEGSKMDTLYRIADGRVESIGFTVPKDAAFLDIPLSQLNLKPNILIASIIRDGEVMIPKGATTMQAGDNVVVVAFAGAHKIFRLKDIFAVKY